MLRSISLTFCLPQRGRGTTEVVDEEDIIAQLSPRMVKYVLMSQPHCFLRTNVLELCTVKLGVEAVL